jgi:CheY-like chemotaxis protein
MKTILIIDDDQDLCEEIEDRIKAMGHQGISVHCLEDALETLEKSDIAIDLILLDLEIPVKAEGPTRLETGLNLLDRIVSEPGTPPIIVITSHGKGHHELCRNVLLRGAQGFIAKPFDEDPPEDQIKRLLANSKTAHPQPNGHLRPFRGGEMIVHEGHIDLMGIEIGGTKSDSIIRRVITLLAPKPGSPGKRMAAMALSDALGNIGAPAVTSAIRDFRNQCIDKMRAAGVECGKNDIIETARGGYHINEWIKVREGLDESKRPQDVQDAALILRLFARSPKLTRKQIGDGVDIPTLRVKAALGHLTDQKRIKHVGGSGITTTYEIIAAP